MVEVEEQALATDLADRSLPPAKCCRHTRTDALEIHTVVWQ
jgi:hypothetical protein